MIFTLGGVSGGHFNPAVTIGLMVTKKQEPKESAAYIGNQLGGAVFAGLLFHIPLPHENSEGSRYLGMTEARRKDPEPPSITVFSARIGRVSR
jgi:glycerol uptake facilitator-like aquaporin